MLAHARILLKANHGEGGPGWADVATAGAVEVHLATVARVRRTHAPKLDGKHEAHLVALACSAPPAGRERWTLRLLADALVQPEAAEAVSHETVRCILKKTRSSRG